MGTPKSEPLEGWLKTTLWFRWDEHDDSNRWEPQQYQFDVWYPPCCSDEDRARLLEKNAGRIVSLIRSWKRVDSLITQGGYREEPDYAETQPEKQEPG